ncbi:ATP-binding protein [Streptomyces sp. NPDC093982]|uniref:ATP-binding protein n=1 Tax=Streptomyces sp. NPDC093982 TaxID=3155077 RepID=UPI00342E39ED
MSALSGGLMLVSAAFEGCEEIAEARAVARLCLEDLQGDHAVPVSDWAVDMVQLVVSELVTNAEKYAPGPYLLTFEVLHGDVVEISVWDTDTRMPVILAEDPQRVGQNRLEIVTAVCQSFEVHREPVGKRVVVAIPLADAPVGDMAGSKVF